MRVLFKSEIVEVRLWDSGKLALVWGRHVDDEGAFSWCEATGDTLEAAVVSAFRRLSPVQVVDLHFLVCEVGSFWNAEARRLQRQYRARLSALRRARDVRASRDCEAEASALAAMNGGAL